MLKSLEESVCRHRHSANAVGRILVFLTAAGLASCSMNNNGYHFAEEVELGSGEVIQVERQLKYRTIGEFGGPGGAEILYSSLDIVSSFVKDRPLKWESTDGLDPILLDREPTSGEWVILATFISCEAWYQLGRPKHPYVEFRFRQGAWQTIPLTDGWFGRPANMLVDNNTDSEAAFVTLAQKKLRNANNMIGAKYRSVISNWKTNC